MFDAISRPPRRLWSRFPAVALLALALLSPRAAQAQVLIGMLLGDKVASDRFHIGFDFAGNLSFLSGMGSQRPSIGPSIALLGEYRFAPHAYVQAEFLATSTLGARHLPAGAFDPPDVPADLTDALVARRLSYVGLPVLVKAGLFHDRLHLGLGPEVLFLTGARDVYTGTADPTLELHHKRAKDFSRVDVGPTALVEFKLWSDPYAISAALRYFQGFVDVERGTARTVWNSALTVGVILPLGKPPECPDCDAPEDVSGR